MVFEKKRDGGGVKFLSISEEWENKEVPQLEMAATCLHGIVTALRSCNYFLFFPHCVIFLNSDANSEALQHFIVRPTNSGGNI